MGSLLLAMMLATGGYALQPPGQFHGDEPVARDGERWLALRTDGTLAALEPATLTIAQVEDPVLDEPGQRTGRSVDAREGSEGVVAFLRGGRLAPGPVEVADIEALNDDARHPIDEAIVFQGLRHRLRSTCRPRGTKTGGQQQFDCAITLEAKGRTQTLVRMQGYAENDARVWLGDDASPTLLFAGDLDGDGRLDLIFDITDHYNLSRPTLFLSSPAAAGELLREVARFESVGC